MTSQTPNMIDDLTTLWNHESRSFLRYVVEESSPISIVDHDAAILAAFAEVHRRESQIAEGLFGMLEDVGVRPDAPCYDMEFGFYNYVTPEVLARRYWDVATRELAGLEKMAARQQGEDGGEGELLEIVRALIASREAARGQLEALVPAVSGSLEGREIVAEDAEGGAPK